MRACAKIAFAFDNWVGIAQIWIYSSMCIVQYVLTMQTLVQGDSLCCHCKRGFKALPYKIIIIYLFIESNDWKNK